MAALRGAPRTGSAERARRRCSSPCRPARGRSLVDCSHRASRITAVEKCGRCGRQLISSICCRDLTASLYLRGGVAVFWGTEVSRLRRRGARGTESGVNGRRLDEPAQALEHLPRLLLLRFATADAAVWATSDERQKATREALCNRRRVRKGTRTGPWETRQSMQANIPYPVHLYCGRGKSSWRWWFAQNGFSVQGLPRPDAKSRGTSPAPVPWRGLRTEAAARSREDNDWAKGSERGMFCMSKRRKSPAMSPIA